jgi:hypothetical protein
MHKIIMGDFGKCVTEINTIFNISTVIYPSSSYTKKPKYKISVDVICIIRNNLKFLYALKF